QIRPPVQLLQDARGAAILRPEATRRPPRLMGDSTRLETASVALESPVILAARSVTKRFGALVALDRVDFDLRPGEVHALIGQNGAGKSTLVSLMSGGSTPDEGVIEVMGVRASGISPEEARRARVRVIHQERQLCPHLSVAENIHLGSLPTRRGDIVDW